jgi:AraC-like DNA-binding protein
MSGLGAAPIRYWKPGDALAPYVTAYHSFSGVVPPGMTLRDAFLPSWATIRITLPGSASWSLQIGARTYDPVPERTFAGPSSYAGYLATTGGTSVGVGLLPMGWAQLFGGDVSRYSNRLVPLEQIDPGAIALHEALAGGCEVPEAFEAWLTARLNRRPPADPRIAQLYALLDDPAMPRIEAIAEQLEMSPRALTTMARASFGFTPKLLLRRTRFLRALSAVLTNASAGPEAIDAAGYWDRSHFLRDSHLFLGCSIREFNRRRGPLNQMALMERARSIGSAV